MRDYHAKQVLFKLKKSIFLFLVIFVLATVMLAFSCETAQAKTKVSLTKKVSMTAGKTKKLTLKNNKKKVKWTTSNKKVVKITKSTKKNVTIKALKQGSAKITAKIGTKKYICKVTVKSPAKVSFPTAKTMTAGNTATLKLKNNKKKVTWTTSNKKIVKITKKSKTGVDIQALTSGTAQITAKIGTKKYTCKVTVKAVSPVPSDPEPSESYTYSITPLLAPFDEYFYVKTDNPDPSNIRFVDKNSKYYTAADTSLCSIVPTSKRFLDVRYENESTGRVTGGYIFEKQNANMDGGELILQIAAKASFYSMVQMKIMLQLQVCKI